MSGSAKTSLLASSGRCAQSLCVSIESLLIALNYYTNLGSYEGADRVVDAAEIRGATRHTLLPRSTLRHAVCLDCGR